MSWIMALWLACPSPVIENKTRTWEPLDQQTLNRAKKRCDEWYGKCLVRFIKKDEGAYRAYCGRKNRARMGKELDHEANID